MTGTTDCRSGLAFACGLITFAVVWPVLSQDQQVYGRNPGTYAETASSRFIFPYSTSFITAVEVNNLETEAIKLIVPTEKSLSSSALPYAVRYRILQDHRLL